MNLTIRNLTLYFKYNGVFVSKRIKANINFRETGIHHSIWLCIPLVGIGTQSFIEVQAICNSMVGSLSVDGSITIDGKNQALSDTELEVHYQMDLRAVHVNNKFREPGRVLSHKAPHDKGFQKFISKPNVGFRRAHR